MITLKAMIVDVAVLGLIAWSMMQFLHYKRGGKN